MDIIIDTQGQSDLLSRDHLIDFDDNDDLLFEDIGNNLISQDLFRYLGYVIGQRMAAM